MKPPLYLCLRLPEFAAQALIRLRPPLRKAAVAVLQGERPLEKVCAANLQARRLGLRHAMTRTEAESFSNLTLLRRSLTEEESTATTLMEMASRFTPRMEELPRTSALTLALDMTGSEGIFGSPQAIGQKLLRAVRELGLSARIAASQNLHTAACLVRAPQGTATDMLTIVPPNEERTRLNNLPLSVLGLTDDLADTFNAWGLRSVGELAALSPVDIVTRLGDRGHRLLRLARGEEPHLFVPVEPAFALQEHLAFDAPVDNLDSLLFLLGPMVDQLILRARSRALLLASLTVRLHLERPDDAADRNLNTAIPGTSHAVIPSEAEGPAFAPAHASRFHTRPGAPSSPTASSSVRVGSATPQISNQITHPLHERTLKPALPVDDRTLLLKLLHLDLQAHPAPAAILAITLTAEPGPRPGVQSGLFSPQLPEPMRLEVTLARIAALVGEDRVGCAVLTDTHHPEAFRMHHLCLHEETHQRRQKQMRELDMARTGVALRRIRPPRPVQIWQHNNRLHSFAFKDPNTPPVRYTVQRAFGPWRQSGHWWSGAAWSREEWDVDAIATDATRILCVLTHDLLCGQWRMEAIYD